MPAPSWNPDGRQTCHVQRWGGNGYVILPARQLAVCHCCPAGGCHLPLCACPRLLQRVGGTAALQVQVYQQSLKQAPFQSNEEVNEADEAVPVHDRDGDEW